MAQIYTMAGRKLFIGNKPFVDKDEALIKSDFDTQTSWLEIKGWVTMGAIGGDAALATSEQINAPFTKKAKGVKNGGSMENTFDLLDGDPGQAALIAAANSAENFAFKIAWPRAGKSNPALTLFAGLVMGNQQSGGGANDPNRFSSTIEIQNNLVAVVAT